MVEDTRRHRAFFFSTQEPFFFFFFFFLCLDYQKVDEHFRVFEPATQTHGYVFFQPEKRSRLKFATFRCNLPPISKYWLNITRNI